MIDEFVVQHNTSAFNRQELSARSVKAKAFKFAVEGYCQGPQYFALHSAIVHLEKKKNHMV